MQSGIICLESFELIVFKTKILTHSACYKFSIFRNGDVSHIRPTPCDSHFLSGYDIKNINAHLTNFADQYRMLQENMWMCLDEFEDELRKGTFKCSCPDPI